MMNKLVRANGNRYSCRVSYVSSDESSWHTNRSTPYIGNDFSDRYRDHEPFSGEDFEYTNTKVTIDDLD